MVDCYLILKVRGISTSLVIGLPLLVAGVKRQSLIALMAAVSSVFEPLDVLILVELTSPEGLISAIITTVPSIPRLLASFG